MKARRLLAGSEAFEVGLIGIILLCLSIGAVTIFGGQIQKVFQGDSSPVMVSANSMGDPTDTTNPRTNVNSSLVTSTLTNSSDMINIGAHQDLSIGQAVGTETTGATGGDAAIGGTYEVTNYDELYDGDVTTTGNTLLNQALRDKKAALELKAQASSAKDEADLMMNKATGLKEKADAEMSYATKLGTYKEELREEFSTVSTHLDLLYALEAAAGNISTGLEEAIGVVEVINTTIDTQTDANLSNGKTLLEKNQEQIDALTLAQAMQRDYDNSWEMSCVGDPPVCEEINTSQYSLTDINLQFAYSDQLLNEVQGMVAGVNNVISAMSVNAAATTQQAENYMNSSQSMQTEAKNTLIAAFKKGDEIFGGCSSVEDMIKKAEIALGSGGKVVKNKDYAFNAIELLKNSSTNYENAKKYFAEAEQYQNDLQQNQQILSQYQADAEAAALALNSNLYDTCQMEFKSTMIEQAISAAPGEIQLAISELGAVSQSIDKTDAMIARQTSIYTELNSQAANFSTEAASLYSTATSLLDDGNTMENDAQQLIDSVVTKTN